MNIIDFNARFEQVIDEAGYKLYFGTKNMYMVEHRDVFGKEVILEPFRFNLRDENGCFISTTFNIWICRKREVDEKFNDAEKGMNTAFIQEMIDDTRTILNKINESGFMVITQKIDEINLQHYQADSSQSANTQSMIRASFPIRLYV
ncbi:MAG: hypothetical protein ACOCZ5_02805 [bacterium]